MEIPVSFYGDAAMLLESIIKAVDNLAASPGSTDIFEEINLNLEILTGTLTLASFSSISKSVISFKKKLNKICGSEKKLTEEMYEYSKNYISKLLKLIDKNTQDITKPEEVEKFLEEYGEDKTEEQEKVSEKEQKDEKEKSKPSEPVKKESVSSKKPDVSSPPEKKENPGSKESSDNSGISLEIKPIDLAPWDRSQFGDLLEDFVEETEEILVALDKDLLELENSPDNIDLLNLIFRNMHTLKGNSATLGLEVMNFVAHRSENILDKVRKKSLTLTSSIIDVMLECTDVFKEIMNRIVNDEDPNIDIAGLIAILDHINSGKPYPVEGAGSDTAPAAEKTEEQPSKEEEAVSESKPEETAREKVEVSVPAPPTPAKPEKKSKSVSPPKKEPAKKKASKKIETSNIRVDITKLDNVMNLIGEIVIDKIRLNQKIRKLTDLVSLVNNIIYIIEGSEEDTYEENCQIFVEDKINDYTKKLILDADIYKLHAAEVETLERIVESLKIGQVEKISQQYLSEAEDVSGELKRISNLFKESIQELSFLVEHLSLITNELQEGIIQMRMVPVQQLFDKVPRIVRTLSKDLKKKINLEVVGGETELDKTVIEQLGDPMMHLIRNSIDHGVESPEDRAQKGKSEDGTVTLKAEHKGNQVVISITDDGKGINDEVILNKAISLGLVNPDQAAGMQRSEILEFIFVPGFSSAEKVTEVSGRGVGMDVVMSNIKKLKGTVDIDSEVGEGTTMTIRLPLTLAIIQVVLIKCSNQIFAIQNTSIEETINVKNEEIMQIGPKSVLNLRGEIVSIVKLSDILNLPPVEKTGKFQEVVIINIGDKRIGLIIDGMLGQQEIVIKTLGSILKNVEHISGATILGEGNVVLILDILGIYTTAKRMAAGLAHATASVMKKESIKEKAAALETAKNILVVDDSKTIRKTIRSVLETAGYLVGEAEDGVDALDKAKEKSYDLFTIDIMMPRMDGYELTKNLRGMQQYVKTPIIMVSSRSEEIDKMRGLDAGADDYVTKPFEKHNLVKLISKFIG